MDDLYRDGDVPAAMRRSHMLALVKSKDFVRVSELSTRFRVSEVTVRADLDIMTEQGLIRRIRGGALPLIVPHPERPFEEMQSAHGDEKARIGRYAASLVSRGESIILDVGTTTTAVAQALAQRTDLCDVVIFTNALSIALALEPAIPRFTVVVTGGTLRPLQHSLVDPLGTLMLERITAHTLFLGCNGIDPSGGITNINLPEAEIKRRMLKAARRRIVVADGSKVGNRELAFLGSIAEVDMLITDDAADATIVSTLREMDLEVVIAPA